MVLCHGFAFVFMYKAITGYASFVLDSMVLTYCLVHLVSDQCGNFSFIRHFVELHINLCDVDMDMDVCAVNGKGFGAFQTPYTTQNVYTEY